MKILILQDYLRSGGTERQSILLANSFAARGHETYLVTFRPGGPLASTVSTKVHRRALQPFDLGLDWFAPGLVPTVRALQPDIALCMGRMANCYGDSLQKICPTLATMRTGKKLPWLFRRSLQAVQQVVANSAEARDTLIRQYGVAAGKVSVIYNSLVFPPEVPTANAAASRNGFRRQHGADDKTFVMLCVAMFRPEKNQRELIEIAAGLPEQLDWQLWLAGDGPARAACEQLVAERKLGQRVKFLGFQRDPSALYAAADLAVHASSSESLSNFLIEAQAQGLLAVAYEAQGIRECFVPGRTGWVIPRHDQRAFRDTLSRRISEPSIAHRERAADARAFARMTFDSDRQVSAYLDLFARLVARP